MTRAAELVSAGLVLAGGAFVAGVGFIAQSIATGNPRIDRWGIRGRVAIECLKTFGPRVLRDLSIPRAMLLIIDHETRGNPREAVYLGDQTASGGPSIGPGQVYRRTAKDLRLWTPPAGATDDQERAAYAALATDEALTIRWAVKVFASKLRAANGDVAEAIRRYNGSGPAAESYRAAVLDRADGLGWVLA